MIKRCALIGVGSRGMSMFGRPLAGELTDLGQLCALVDKNPIRLAQAQQELGADIATYTDLGEALEAAHPDIAIVATVDRTHAAITEQALEAGCEVITEKPMATTAADVRRILSAEERTGRTVRVSFNARYGAATETIYRLLREGVIGRVLSADFYEFLDTSHGADYFRRWHREKRNSGGLLVHKATHHFDQLNWWIGADPVRVYADGGLRYYGPKREARGERCLTCEHKGACPFYLDLDANPGLQKLYRQAEGADGYYRDRCVFADEIDIEDTLAVVIRYKNGVMVNYGLCAHAPFEGQRIGFNGTQGRLEVDLVNTYHGMEGGELTRHRFGGPTVVRVNPLFGKPYEVPVEAREDGGHGGADRRIRQHLFNPQGEDTLAQRAGAWAGAMSALVGIAGNLSLAEGRPVEIRELLET